MRAFARVAAGHQHTCRAIHVQPFAARLNRHGKTGQARFEANFVGDHAFQGRHMRRAGCDAVAIHVEADGEIEIGRALQSAVEYQSLKSVVGVMAARRLVSHRVSQVPQRARQYVDTSISAAAAPDIERRGSEKTDPQI